MLEINCSCQRAFRCVGEPYGKAIVETRPAARMSNVIASSALPFFLEPNLREQIPDIWQLVIEPFLAEYFFDQPDQIEAFPWQKISSQLPS